MKILQIDIPNGSGSEDGIQNLKMNRLGDVVLLAGPNGAGKSRILRRINWAAQKKLTQEQVTNIHSQIENLTRTLQVQPQHQNINGWKSAIEMHQQNLEHSSWIKTDDNKKPQIVEFVPKTLTLTDPNSLNKMRVIDSAKNIEHSGIGNLPAGALSKIQHVQNQYREATHQDLQISHLERSKIIDDYQRLQEYIFAFLGTKLGRNSNGDATLFERQLGNADLSDGQKVLIQFCLAIYTQVHSLDNLVLFLDEPENHLHPSVLLTTIDKIREVAPNAQLWIATHSVPLLSHFEPNSIWFVSDGAVKHAGKTPETVLRGLLGSDEEICRLESFLSLPAQFATSQYSLECLIEPGVSEAIHDDQTKQITKALLTTEPQQSPQRILDYGAGRGRLIGSIFDHFNNDQQILSKTIDYRAFEPNNKSWTICKEVIHRAYGDSENRCFESHTKLLEMLDPKSVSVVILSNVLHEIDPKEWLKLFSQDGLICNLLSDDGKVLIVEDQRIPTGELAYSKGFLVLDTLQLKRLFNISETDKNFICFDERNDGRLKAHAIPKSIIMRITSESRKEAITSLAQTAKNEITKLRSEDASYKNGLLHAFWVQQFANAQLSLTEL